MFGKALGTGFTIGFAMGAVIGLAIGVLYAPRLGEETRGQFKTKMGKVKEKATEVIDKNKEATTEARKVTRAKLEEVKEKAK
jgi:gas vesicle protein